MKLHLPCALRGALLACFAFACAAPTWAGDLFLDDLTESEFLYASNGTTVTLKPQDDGAAANAVLGTLNVTESIRLNIGTNSSSFSYITINNILVADKKNITIYVAAGTTVFLNNVNFTGTVKYVLGTGANLVINANDLTKGCVSGNGTVLLSGGIIDASKTSSPFFVATDYAGSAAQLEIDEWSSIYEAKGSNISFDLNSGATVHINGPGGMGGDVQHAGDGFYPLTWQGKTSGSQKIPKDSPSVIIDPKGVYRDGAKGSKFWLLQRNVSVQSLQGGTMGDKADMVLASLQKSDKLRFAGGTLTSSKSVTLSNEIEVQGSNKVKLSPAANTTMTFLKGEGALSNANGLELSGGSGSTVVLKGVKTTAPERITFTTNNTTLAIAGPKTLTLDPTKNTFRATSGLSKLDGGTMIYLAQPTDSIGSLSNSSGTLTINKGTSGVATALTAKKLVAGTLNIKTDGTSVVSTTVTAGNLVLGDAPNSGISLTATTLNSSKSIELGEFSTLTATTLNATNVTIGRGALLTGNHLTATGTLTVTEAVAGYPRTHGLVVGSTTLSGNGKAATVKGMDFSTSLLSAKSVNDAIITVAQAKSKAAGQPTLSLGTVSNTIINTAAGATIEGTTLNNTVVNAAKSLTLSGTTHDSSSTISVAGTGATVKLVNATLINEGGMTIDGTEYKATNIPKSLVMSASANQSKMVISEALVDLRGMKEEELTALPIITSTTGQITGSKNITFITSPGMVGYERYTGDSMSFILRDESDRIVAELMTSDNVTAVAASMLAIAQPTANSTKPRVEGVLAELYDYIRDTSNADYGTRMAALEALASGSVTMMADSQRRNVTNTIHSLRNRIIQMGNAQGMEPETNLHAWIEADGSNYDVDQDGAYAGYEYQTWGGSVGVHADVGNFSFGAAIAASYGDLTSHSSDHAEGDHDAVSLSAFARHQHGRWTQMGILSIGRNEVEMERSIYTPMTYSADKTYHGEGDASGHTITAYYEAGYTISLTEDSSQVIQPLVSVMLTSARMGELTETGTIGNAGICSDTQDYFYGTVGIGARYQIVLGENVNNRLCFAEVRAKLVQDFGDETNETTAFLAANPGQTFTLKGADVGRTGFQLGAGISVPTGVYTTLFADVDADIRSGATSVSGSVGVRVEF